MPAADNPDLSLSLLALAILPSTLHRINETRT
jgi:hypothetical protein